MLLWLFLIIVLAGVGKLIYDVQQNKRENKEIDELCKTEADAELKDKFQTLAGIKGEQTHSLSVDELKKKFENTEFPAPDPSIPVITAKLTTIGGEYGDSDPLASVPMSRVSKEAKEKMAEIAKEDISKRLEETNKSIFPESVEYTEEYYSKVPAKCGCGRSETGFCTGLHRIPKKDWAAGIRDIPAEKPKRKYNKKSK